MQFQAENTTKINGLSSFNNTMKTEETQQRSLSGFPLFKISENQLIKSSRGNKPNPKEVNHGTNFVEKETDVKGLMFSVMAGNTIVGGVCKEGKRLVENVTDYTLVGLDVDNTFKARDPSGEWIESYKHYFTVEEFLEHPFTKAHACLVYTTPSHRTKTTPDGKPWDKFRAFFLLPEPVVRQTGQECKDVGDAIVLNLIIKSYNGAGDLAAIDSTTRLWYGCRFEKETGFNPIVYKNFEAFLPDNFVEESLKNFSENFEIKEKLNAERLVNSGKIQTTLKEIGLDKPASKKTLKTSSKRKVPEPLAEKTLDIVELDTKPSNYWIKQLPLQDRIEIVQSLIPSLSDRVVGGGTYDLVYPALAGILHVLDDNVELATKLLQNKYPDEVWEDDRGSLKEKLKSFVSDSRMRNAGIQKVMQLAGVNEREIQKFMDSLKNKTNLLKPYVKEVKLIAIDDSLPTVVETSGSQDLGVVHLTDPKQFNSLNLKANFIVPSNYYLTPTLIEYAAKVAYSDPK